MEKRYVKRAMIVAAALSLIPAGVYAESTEGLYTNGQWDSACSRCWPAPRTAKNNHCKPSDCAIQGYYHCKQQNPPLAVDDDPRLISLIKSGQCTYVSRDNMNAGERDYVNSLQVCSQVLDKMAGRFTFPANPADASRLKVDFYLTHFKASILGSAYAQLKLAVDYDVGMGTKQDRARATELYQEAAKKGLPFAQYAIAARYAYGITVPKDKDKAIMWLNKVLNTKPLTQADKEAKEMVDPCAIKLIERLTPT